jgi:plasmid replication initiation protein
MKKYIKQAYDRAVLINNNGHAYEFFTRIDRNPTKIYMAFDEEHLNWVQENNKRYMEQEDLDELWELIYRDRKPFWTEKGDVIINWKVEKLKFLAFNRNDPEAKRKVNKYIAEYKEEHQELVQEALEGAFHKNRDLKAIEPRSSNTDLIPVRKTTVAESCSILNELVSKKFTLQELRLFYIYLWQLNESDISTRKLRLSIFQFCKVMEVFPQKMSCLQKVTDELLKKVIFIPRNNGGFSAFQLFSRCRVSKEDSDRWFFEIDGHDSALTLMYDYKSDNFKYRLQNVFNIESINQFQLYELLKQEEQYGEWTITVAELKVSLGIEETAHQNFDDFKKNVLDVCQKAINSKTDICFTYEPHSRSGVGGEIQTLRFVITKNQDFESQFELEEFVNFQQGNHIRLENISNALKKPKSEQPL